MVPKALKKGGTIGIVGPASPMKPDRLERGLEYLRALGYQTKLGEHISATRGYLAGSDEERASDLHRMFRDDEVDAIFCSRGGYGTPRILDLLDFDMIASNPKILVGYSDITALQLALFKMTSLVSIAGPMPAVEMGLGIDAFTAKHFWSMISTPEMGRKLTAGQGPLRTLVSGSASGRLLGGNLSLICTLVGTEYLPDFAGAILFIEEVGEEPYRIDRKFAQLKLSGLLAKLTGIVIGRFTDCAAEDSSRSLGLDEVIADYTKDLGIPVLTGLPHGHGSVKYSLPVGVDARLDGATGTLEILTSPVA